MTTSIPTVLSTSPFWTSNGLNAANSTTNPYAMAFSHNSTERMLSQLIGKASSRALRATIRALTGVAPGASKASTNYRIAAINSLTNNADYGGNRTIEAQAASSGNSVAADVTYINKWINDQINNMQPTIANYPVDLSGNGGGSKVGR
jgi:hypothetical protein